MYARSMADGFSQAILWLNELTNWTTDWRHTT